jgi:hypothetical protein
LISNLIGIGKKPLIQAYNTKVGKKEDAKKKKEEEKK